MKRIKKVEVINSGKPQGTFTNDRLPTRLGAVEGAMVEVDSKNQFRYGVQIKFTSDSIDMQQVEVERFVVKQTCFTDPDPKLQKYADKPKDITKETPREKDHPNQKNLYRDKSTLIVFDAPGPTRGFVVQNEKSYPIVFEGKFVLTLKYKGEPLAELTYFIRLEKKTLKDEAQGKFKLLKQQCS